MSSFITPLVVSPTFDGRHWRLVKSFSYRVGKPYSGVFVRVPKEFITDFASIPRFLWFLPYWAKFNKSPVVHDRLYDTHKVMGKKISRKRADKIFLEAMLNEWRFHRSRYIIAYLEYLAVRVFGGLTWGNKKKE